MAKFYITTAIPYVNAAPHLGFALEAIQADVLARYHRLKGDDVFFLTGADEHGIKIIKTAQKQGKSPKELIDENTEKFKELTKVLNISNDDFIRTSDQKRHWPSAQKLWKILEVNGDIYKKEYNGLYCSGCEAFLTQKDLINGKCLIHQKEPELIKEENYFFKLSKYSQKIEELIEKDEIKIIPHTRKHEILSLIKNGLEDVSFSRPSKDLLWGIPIPGDNTQTMYVWCDALTNYISALDFAEDSPNFKKYWPADIHCIGKDILRFHAVIWPGMLLSAGLPLPKKIFVHGFITSAGQKMSKSLGNVVNPFELVGKYGVDTVRYYLLREIPATEDGDFSVEKFEARYNGDLANGLGNLVSRFSTMAEKLDIILGEPEDEFKKKIDNIWMQYKITLNNFEFDRALKVIWDLISFCDGYITEKKPWELLKSDISSSDDSKLNLTSSDNVRLIFSNLFWAIANVAWLLEPFLPQAADKILKILNIEKDIDGWKGDKLAVKKSQALFPRLN